MNVTQSTFWSMLLPSKGFVKEPLFRTRELIARKSSGLSANDLRRHSWGRWYSTIANRQMCSFWKKQQESLMKVLSRCRSAISSFPLFKIFLLLVFLCIIRDMIISLDLFSLQRSLRKKNKCLLRSLHIGEEWQSRRRKEKKTPAILNSNYQ